MSAPAFSIHHQVPAAISSAPVSAMASALPMALELPPLPDSAAACAAHPSRRAPNQMLSQETVVDHTRLISQISDGKISSAYRRSAGVRSGTRQAILRFSATPIAIGISQIGDQVNW